MITSENSASRAGGFFQGQHQAGGFAALVLDVAMD